MCKKSLHYTQSLNKKKIILFHPHYFHLGVSTNGAFALCARIGAELIKALGAHVLVILLHILLAMQIVTAVVAVKAISHGGG